MDFFQKKKYFFEITKFYRKNETKNIFMDFGGFSLKLEDFH